MSTFHLTRETSDIVRSESFCVFTAMWWMGLGDHPIRYSHEQEQENAEAFQTAEAFLLDLINTLEGQRALCLGVIQDFGDRSDISPSQMHQRALELGEITFQIQRAQQGIQIGRNSN